MQTFQDNVKTLLKRLLYMYEDLFKKNVLEKNYLLKDIYKGHRCFILGTGRSVDEIDFSLLSNEYTFVCNFFYQHKDIEQLNPKFYTEISPLRSMKNHFSKMDLRSLNIHLIPSTKNAHIHYYSLIDSKCNNPDTIFFLKASSKAFFEKNKIFVKRRVHYLKPSLHTMNDNNLSNDLTHRMSFFNGSIFSMIASAIFMGFKEIYLCGCGYSYYPAQIFHFYDPIRFSKDIPKSIRNMKMKEMAARNDSEILHIKYDNDYYSPVCVIWRDVPQCHKIMHDFAISHGVDIFNIVPYGFESPVYERVTLEDVYQLLTV